MRDPETTSRLTEWFRKWRSPLRKFLIGKVAVPFSDLEDVSQEVFLRLLMYERIELVEHPQAYLYKMAHNVAAEWAIRSRCRHPHDSRWLAGLVADELPQDGAEFQELEREVARAVNTLRPRHREVLKLHFAGGLTRPEIAERLNMTPRSVKRSIIYSFDRLREELDPQLAGDLRYGRE
jgi:RNA polymerase sigma-70 factor (ECF subfamily)